VKPRRGNTKASAATSNRNDDRRDCAALVEDELEMMLKRLLQIGAALFLGGQGVLAVVGIVTYMTQAEAPQIDGYGVAPIAEMAEFEQRG
jgi:hypothetical protein